MQRLCQHLAHIIYKSCPKDDLQLVARYKHTLDQVDILNRMNVRLVIVLQYEAETSRAVSDSEDIVSSSRKAGKFFRYLLIAFSFFSIHL